MSEEKQKGSEELREQQIPAGETPYQQEGANNPCPECGGSGRIQENVNCPMCGGTGKVVAAGGGG